MDTLVKKSKFSMAPTLHKPVPMGSRVYIPEYFSSKRKKLAGTVVGVASLHVIYTYIVLSQGSRFCA